MNVISSGPIDSRREIQLRGEITTEYTETWKSTIEAVFETFNSFVSSGGLHRLVEFDPQVLSGKLVWERECFVYTWPNFRFDKNGLGVIIRMLGHLRHGEEGLSSISILGAPISQDHEDVINGINKIVDNLPAMMPSLPFDLDISPTSAWINIVCDVSPLFPPEISLALHEAIWTWGKVANAGGFQVDSDIDEASSYDGFGVGIDGPTVADDFLEWHCLMTGVDFESLICLVNVIGYFSKETYPVSAVYIG